MTTIRPLVPIVALVVWSGALASPAAGQYFGQNKVQHDRFDFQVLKTDHFDIHFYPEEQAATEQAARLAERWYARLSRLLRHELGTRQTLILYAGHPHFEQTNVIEEMISEGTGGVTEGLKRRVVMPFASGLKSTDHVLGHELVHAFQYDILGLQNQAAARLPLWFIEGMAEYLSVGPIDPHTAMWMRSAAMQEKLPTIAELSSPRYFPYRWGHALWAYIGGRFGDEVIGDILQAGGHGDAIDAIESVLQIKVDDLSKQWHESLRSTYRAILDTKAVVPENARPMVGRATGSGELNVAPALSPDGSQVLYFSERDLLSIDLFVADARTGQSRKKLIETATNPHLDSLQFIYSSGAWDREGRRVALGSVREGKPALLIMDVARNRTDRTIVLDSLNEVFNPSFSPDGRSIVFSAIKGGISDLYAFDLQAGSLKQLTNDLYADVHPAWSPDGRRIAFATDRFSTPLETLHFGTYRLALLEVDSGAVRQLPGFADAKNINPQWTSDGRGLYFLSDRGGITNIYRLDLAEGSIRQITDLATGVSGITDLSPALSASATGNHIAFSVYDNGRYEIYGLEGDVLRGRPVTDAPGPDAGALPPLERGESEVVSALSDPSTGLPPPGQFTSEEYKPRLGLDFIGQPTIVAGADRFGTFFGGGIALLFSDTLGNHTLGTAFQLTGRLDDFAGQAAYINRTHRLNWGVVGQWIPYVTGGFSTSLVALGGRQVGIREDTFIDRQIHREAAGLLAYPFNRAQRVEFTVGGRSIDFQRQVETRVYDQAGFLLSEEIVDLPAGETLNLAEASAALVYDTAIFGATSPIAGNRYRLEIAPTLGDLTFSTALADYRQYVRLARPLTFAARALHIGRYGRDGGDTRLSPLFLGYPQLVRGYEFGSFSATECRPNTQSSCPEFDQLLGSRLFVANVELRFPLVGIFRGELDYGPLPVEGIVFADGGYAWATRSQTGYYQGSRQFVRSAGAGLRVNAFGFAVVEIDAVRALDRPTRGWLWVFNLTPGF